MSSDVLFSVGQQSSPIVLPNSLEISHLKNSEMAYKMKSSGNSDIPSDSDSSFTHPELNNFFDIKLNQLFNFIPSFLDLYDLWKRSAVANFLFAILERAIRFGNYFFQKVDSILGTNIGKYSDIIEIIDNKIEEVLSVVDTFVALHIKVHLRENVIANTSYLLTKIRYPYEFVSNSFISFRSNPIAVTRSLFQQAVRFVDMQIIRHLPEGVISAITFPINLVLRVPSHIASFRASFHEEVCTGYNNARRKVDNSASLLFERVKPSLRTGLVKAQALLIAAQPYIPVFVQSIVESGIYKAVEWIRHLERSSVAGPSVSLVMEKVSTAVEAARAAMEMIESDLEVVEEEGEGRGVQEIVDDEVEEEDDDGEEEEEVKLDGDAK